MKYIHLLYFIHYYNILSQLSHYGHSHETTGSGRGGEGRGGEGGEGRGRGGEGRGGEGRGREGRGGEGRGAQRVQNTAFLPWSYENENINTYTCIIMK